MSKKIKCANHECSQPITIGREAIHNGRIFCSLACARYEAVRSQTTSSIPYSRNSAVAASLR